MSSSPCLGGRESSACLKLGDQLDRWIPRGVSFQRPCHRLIAVASLGRLQRNRSIRVWFTRYPRTALSDRWRSLGITSLMNIGGIRYVHIHSYTTRGLLATDPVILNHGQEMWTTPELAPRSPNYHATPI
ncbi:hypothetical protein TNCV_1020841 [Trichonephila clavipes]|uniref:Uncharacterized protein n=1 Tax=Trichonephila clavipes TaxID=2585209 RepID=A0A8X6VNF4_TRICX|nr:hypothetical protein TNCV_1020841 [Trichonephila clavipes]